MKGLEFTVDATAMPKGVQMPPPGLGEALRSFALKVLDPGHTSTARETAFAEPYCLKRGGQVLEGLGIDPNDGVRRSVEMALKIFAANSAVAFAAMGVTAVPSSQSAPAGPTSDARAARCTGC